MSYFEKVMDSLPDIKQRCRGVSFVLILVSTAFLGFVVFSPVFFTVFILQLPVARWVVDTIVSTWFALAVATYELIYGVKIVIQGDVSKINKHCSSLIIMNHRTRLDWLFYFSIQARYSSLRRFIISLKDELRHAPGAGWAMQAKHFLFLKRNWETDRIRIESALKHFATVNYYPQLLLFPEGTDFQPSSRKKSKEYAKKHDLKDFEYVLHPRTTGFSAVLGYMKSYNNLEQIVDVTIAYPQNMLQNETELLTGNIPREIVFTVETFDINELPTTDDTVLAQWLEDRWCIKEERLTQFYECKHRTYSNGLDNNKNLDIERDTKLYLVGALIFWLVVSTLVVWCLVYYTTFRWIFITLCVLNTLVSCALGFDQLFARLSVNSN